jgi:hypothetical protein
MRTPPEVTCGNTYRKTIHWVLYVGGGGGASGQTPVHSGGMILLLVETSSGLSGRMVERAQY